MRYKNAPGVRCAEGRQGEEVLAQEQAWLGRIGHARTNDSTAREEGK